MSVRQGQAQAGCASQPALQNRGDGHLMLRRSPSLEALIRSDLGGATPGAPVAEVAMPRLLEGAPDGAAAAVVGVAATGGPPRPTPQSDTTTSNAVAPPLDPTLSMAFTTSYPSITCAPTNDHLVTTTTSLCRRALHPVQYEV